MAWVLNGILRYRSFRLALAFIALTSIYLVAFTLQSDSPVVKIEVLNAQSRAECGLNGLLQAVVRRKRVAIVGKRSLNLIYQSCPTQLLCFCPNT